MMKYLRHSFRPEHPIGRCHIKDAGQRMQAQGDALWNFHLVLDEANDSPTICNSWMPGDKENHHFISENFARKSYRAIRYLNCTGTMFNTVMLCDWSTVGIEYDDEVDQAVQDQLELIRQWGNRRGLKIPFIWVVERHRNHALRSIVLLHLSCDLQAFGRQIDRTIRTLSGSMPLRNRIDEVGTVEIQPVMNVLEQWSCWRRMMKGINPRVLVPVLRNGMSVDIPLKDFLALEQCEYQGRYAFQRAGVSQNIGPKAQNKFFAGIVGYPDAYHMLSHPTDLYNDQYLNLSKIKRLSSLEI